MVAAPVKRKKKPQAPSVINPSLSLFLTFNMTSMMADIVANEVAEAVMSNAKRKMLRCGV